MPRHRHAGGHDARHADGGHQHRHDRQRHRGAAHVDLYHRRVGGGESLPGRPADQIGLQGDAGEATPAHQTEVVTVAAEVVVAAVALATLAFRRRR